MKNRYGTSKNDYQIRIHNYVKRRERYKKDDKLRGRIPTLNKKLKIWRQAVKSITIQEQRVRELDGWIKEFIGVSVKNTANVRRKDHVIAKAIFYRWGLENKIVANTLAQYIGRKHASQIWRSRIRYIRSFSSSPGNREMWYRWKKFLEDIESESNELQLTNNNTNQKG